MGGGVGGGGGGGGGGGEGEKVCGEWYCWSADYKGVFHRQAKAGKLYAGISLWEACLCVIYRKVPCTCPSYLSPDFTGSFSRLQGRLLYPCARHYPSTARNGVGDTLSIATKPANNAQYKTESERLAFAWYFTLCTILNQKQGWTFT